MRKELAMAGLVALGVFAVRAQTLGEASAVSGGLDTLSGAGAGPGPGAFPPAISPGGTLPNPAGGFNPPGTVGFPGAAPAGVPNFGGPPAGYPGFGGAPAGAYGATPGFDVGVTGVVPGAAPGATGQPTPTPIPTIRVLVGKRVYDAVTGQLLEDAIPLDVPLTDRDKYLDDGIHDNGIAGDDVRGNVETIRDKFIGAETNQIKNQLINAVRIAETIRPTASIDYDSLRPTIREFSGTLMQPPTAQLTEREQRKADNQSLMHFYGLHAATIDPLYGPKGMSNLLEMEDSRDELLRDWNNRFLADYRINKSDPKSEFFSLYVPEPPQPPKYPVPPGYSSPQARSQTGPNGQPLPPGGAAGPNIYNGDPVFNVPGGDAGGK